MTSPPVRPAWPASASSSAVKLYVATVSARRRRGERRVRRLDVVPGRIDQDHAPPVEVEAAVEKVTRGPGMIRDEGDVATEERVP